MNRNNKRKFNQVVIKLNAPFAIAMGIVSIILFFLFFFNIVKPIIVQSFLNKIIVELLLIFMIFLFLFLLFYFANSKTFILTDDKFKYFKWKKQIFSIYWQNIKKIDLSTFEGDYYIHIYKNKGREWYTIFDVLFNKKQLQEIHENLSKYSEKYNFLYNIDNIDIPK